jgi:restriction system protein
MGRRSGFVGVMNAIARDAARAARHAEAARRQQIREQERAARSAQREMTRLTKQAERDAKQAEKEARAAYFESRVEEVNDLNAELGDSLAELDNLLSHTLTVDDTISFDSLRIKEEYPPFVPPREYMREPPAPQREQFTSNLRPPGTFARLMPGAMKRYEEALKEAESRFEAAQREYQAAAQKRRAYIESLCLKHEEERDAYLEKTRQRNQEVNELETAYRSGDPATVATYNMMVLERSEYPEGFPQQFRVAYNPDSKELIIDYELPGPEIVPEVLEYKYVKSGDRIDAKPRKGADIKSIYQEVVASIALRTIHEVFEADQNNHLDSVVFNGAVETVDRSTGRDERKYLISVRTTKERFNQLNLSRIDKRECLRNLGAQVSPAPTEMQTVKPIVEYDMADRRFVTEDDVLSTLDARPNLMDLNPFEFEALICNLFTQMGLEAKLTQSSRDGGVDVVAFDTRPIMGGKVVIQAKRYKNTVGVSAVRDLYGTMLNEGASKGILVTTSGYGSDAKNFASNKPIELIDGAGLLYLLDQTGTKARIILPES